MRKILIVLTLSLSACGDDRPPAPTAEESDQLNRTEGMLNALNEEGPAPESSDPSKSTTD